MNKIVLNFSVLLILMLQSCVSPKEKTSEEETLDGAKIERSEYEFDGDDELKVLREYIKEKGLMIAMKGAKAQEELQTAKKAIQKLSLKVIKYEEASLPEEESKRYNIFFKKEQKTEKKYPRSWAEIQKKPL